MHGLEKTIYEISCYMFSMQIESFIIWIGKNAMTAYQSVFDSLWRNIAWSKGQAMGVDCTGTECVRQIV